MVILLIKAYVMPGSDSPTSIDCVLEPIDTCLQLLGVRAEFIIDAIIEIFRHIIKHASWCETT